MLSMHKSVLLMLPLCTVLALADPVPGLFRWLLLEVQSLKDIKTITTEQQAKKRIFLFTSSVFVSGNRTQIAVFR